MVVQRIPCDGSIPIKCFTRPLGNSMRTPRSSPSRPRSMHRVVDIHDSHHPLYMIKGRHSTVGPFLSRYSLGAALALIVAHVTCNVLDPHHSFGILFALKVVHIAIWMVGSARAARCLALLHSTEPDHPESRFALSAPHPRALIVLHCTSDVLASHARQAIVDP